MATKCSDISNPLLWSLISHSRVKSLQFLSGANLLFSASSNGSVRIWKVNIDNVVGVNLLMNYGKDYYIKDNDIHRSHDTSTFIPLEILYDYNDIHICIYIYIYYIYQRVR